MLPYVLRDDVKVVGNFFERKKIVMLTAFLTSCQSEMN